MQPHPQTDVLYLYALGLLKGVGQQTRVRIARTFPDLSALPQLPQERLQEQLGTTAGNSIFHALHHTSTSWQKALEQAKRDVIRHLEQGIVPLALTDASYP